ncbi:chitobiase/beta-hexosaminidase C-terminal domain-containing protein [Paraprevotella xylaniphila]|uniref:chitobiase/beta-hexosaminidase C-terminal domain-containing protein n=1 Tax=Paraprevotella xylaniphila TaxID=454155 RepID=UPI00266C7447|nr:chitobiase/beta-hexosaminidase C-terminal domain-containing protein [Paraprevotella xylaniphila]
MKKFTNVKSGGVILTLLLLALVSGSVWGQEVSDEFTYRDFKATTNSYVEFSNVQGASGAVYAGKSATSHNAIQLRSSGSDCGIVATVSGGKRVKRVSVEWNSNTSSKRQLDVYGKTSAYSSAADLYKSDVATKGELIGEIPNGTTSLEINGDYTYIGIRSNDGALYLDKLVITWEGGEQTQVAAPVFAPANGTTFVDKLTVGASCPTEGATIYYTKDGAEPTTGSDKFPTEGVTLTETTTLKAIAVKDGLDNSEVVTATYTKLEPYTSLKALKESGIATAEGVTCFVELKDAVVTYADSRKAYIQDVTGGLYIYGNNDLKAGTKLNGVVSAQLALYNGLYELKVEGGEFDNVEVAEGVEIPVQEVTVAELNQNFAQYESMRVKVVDATVTSGFNNKNGEIEQNGEKIALRAADESITADVQATVDVTGYPGLFHSDKQLNVILQEDIAVKTAGKTQATLVFEQDAYSVNLGESLIIKATTNSTSPIIYSSEDEEIAKVDSEGKVQAGNKAGTVMITASVAENDEFTGATATCTVNVVDPAAQPKPQALVAKSKGLYYVMKAEEGSANNSLAAEQVEILNNRVVNIGLQNILWNISEDKTIITTPDGKYLTGKDGETDLTIETVKFTWTWSEADNAWLNGNRSFVYSTSGYFKHYATSNIGKSGYADGYTVAMPIVDGYVRNVASGDYGTICLPYAVVAEDMAGADFFSIAGKVMKDGEPQSMVLEQVTTLEAGVPYIFSATSDKLIAAYSGKAVAEAGEANGLVGSFEGQDVAEGMYLISAQNKVQLCGKGCKISGNRAYIDMDKVPEYSGEVGVNQRLISFEDATGISETMAEGGLADVYTLSGVEVRHQVNESEATQGLPQGIYIVNGKKVVVK